MQMDKLFQIYLFFLYFDVAFFIFIPERCDGNPTKTVSTRPNEIDWEVGQPTQEEKSMFPSWNTYSLIHLCTYVSFYFPNIIP